MDLKRACKILGLTEDATIDDVKRAFRNRAKETHPDLHPEKEENFKEVEDAYSTITSLVEVQKAFIDEIKSSIEIQDKRDQIIETVTDNLIKKRNNEIDRIRRATTKKIYIVTIASIPFLITILIILHGLLSMTEVTPYAMMIFLIVIVIAILTLIDNRNVHTQEAVRRYDDKNRELVRMLRDPSKLEYIHHRLRKAFDQKKEPLEKGEILMNISESIEGQLRELVGDTFELYIIQIMEMLRLRGHLQMIGDGKYNVE